MLCYRLYSTLDCLYSHFCNISGVLIGSGLIILRWSSACRLTVVLAICLVVVLVIIGILLPHLVHRPAKGPASQAVRGKVCAACSAAAITG